MVVFGPTWIMLAGPGSSSDGESGESVGESGESVGESGESGESVGSLPEDVVVALSVDVLVLLSDVEDVAVSVGKISDSVKVPVGVSSDDDDDDV